LFEVIDKRKSCRKFNQDKPIPDLADIIALAQRGPSAGAIRGWEIKTTTEKLGPYEAPLYIVIGTIGGKYLARYGDRGYDLYSVQDATIAAAYLQLLLVNAGLASCWIGAFNERLVAQHLQMQGRPIVMLAVGYAND